MTPEDFVSQIRLAVVQQNNAIYKDLFGATLPEAANDAYWKRTLTLYHSLNERDRSVLLEIMRQVVVDTVSNLFGILDGTSPLDSSDEEFLLTSEADGQKLNGNLQDLFLEAEERDK